MKANSGYLFFRNKVFVINRKHSRPTFLYSLCNYINSKPKFKAYNIKYYPATFCIKCIFDPV